MVDILRQTHIVGLLLSAERGSGRLRPRCLTQKDVRLWSEISGQTLEVHQSAMLPAHNSALVASLVATKLKSTMNEGGPFVEMSMA